MTRVLVAEYVSAGGLHGAGAELLAQGLAMRDAMVADLQSLPGVDVRLLVVAPAQTFIEALRREQARADLVWLVAPESEGVLLALAGSVLPERWVGCDRAAIALASSKAATLERLAAQGLATPRDFEAVAARWVVKPDDGAGSWATRVHGSQAAAAADAASRREAVVVEPWVDGEALSLSLLCAGGRAELLAINRQRIGVAPDGALHFHGVEAAAIGLDDRRAEALQGLADAVLRALAGLRGFVGVDLVWHPQAGPVAIEVNPRLTSAYVGLSERLQRPLGADMLRLFGRKGPSLGAR